MATLLLRLAGPMQAWGTDSKFETRRAGTEPSKSGVVGMLAAALGRRRTDAIDDLASMRFGVRVDQEGVVFRDFQTVHSEKDAYLTYRDYLEDAVYLAGFECDDTEYLQELADALAAPAFPLYLGRRSCPPTYPVCLGIREKELENALRSEPWLASEWKQKTLHGVCRILTDGTEQDSSTMIIRDEPVSFSPLHRVHKGRCVKNCGYVNLKAKVQTEHDPFMELE